MLDEGEMASLGAFEGPENSIVVAGDDYVSSRDALRILQVKPQTLYSYVSRGLIRRRAKPGHRTSYYNREDIHRLKSRSVARSGHGPAAASAMYWGEPVLETAITEITPDGPRYREHFAIDLVHDGRSFESVAEYLWSGAWPSSEKTWTNIALPASLACEFAKVDPSDFRYVLTQSIVLLAKTWSCDPALRDTPCPATSILGVMAGAFGFLGPKKEFAPLQNGETVAHALARAMGIKPSAKNVHALNAVLVLTADHELTTPTFVARISASAGCDLPSCILAGLQVHFGYEFGLCCDRLETLIDWSAKAKPGKGGAQPAVPSRTTPGFDNPLYVHGDPRANLLLDIALALEDRHDQASEALQVITKHFPSVQTRINLCEALVTLSQALGLPYQAAGGLLTLARSAGCIAHVLEQRAQNSIIRPRGKFVGPNTSPSE
jgi:citrate synthase